MSEEKKNIELNDNDLEKVSGGYVSIVYSEGTIFVHKGCSDLVIKIIYAIYVDPNNNNNNKYKVDYLDYRQGKSSGANAPFYYSYAN